MEGLEIGMVVGTMLLNRSGWRRTGISPSGLGACEHSHEIEGCHGVVALGINGDAMRQRSIQGVVRGDGAFAMDVR